jgi:hypothetical protein
MRTIKLFFAVVSAAVCLQSCSKDEKTTAPSADYLPLSIGNYWQMDYSEKKEVLNTRVIDNKTYYALRYLDDTTYYRVENNKIYAIEHTDKESLKFDLTAKVNGTWKYNAWTVKLVSKTDTLVINDKKIPDCYQFFFDYPEMVDDEHSIWLAPGIGFIKEQCGECLYPVRKLDKAKINGVETDY